MDGNSVIELRDASVYHAGEQGSRFASRRKSLRGGELVLSGVSLTVHRGELVYFIGRVGSGKSTLLKTLYGEIELAGGEGRIAGYDLRQLKRRDIPHLRRRLGIVFQNCQLLTDRSVFSNLHYVMKATGWKNETDIRRRIEKVLDVSGLTNKEYKMPFQLSGGEQQRLAIARALLNDPEVILADEPTGNLDPAAATAVLGLFRRIVENGCSVIMSTHNVNLIEECPSRTVRFSHGRIEEIDICSILGANPSFQA